MGCRLYRSCAALAAVEFHLFIPSTISQGQTQNVPNRVVNVCSKITGTAHETLQNLYKNTYIRKKNETYFLIVPIQSTVSAIWYLLRLPTT